MRFASFSGVFAASVSVGLIAVGALGSIGCDEKGSTALAPSASSLALSAPVATSMVTKFTIDAAGKTSIDMPGPKEHIKAETTIAAGTLDLDLMNVTNTRGDIKVDLQSLATTTFDEPEKNKQQTEHAQTWLEAASKLPGDVAGPNRFAEYSIRSVENPSVADLTKAPFSPGKDGKQEKHVSATVKGEFLVHGHKVDKSVDVDVTLEYPAGAKPTDKPSHVGIKSKSPMVVTLAEHDVKPRDNVGAIAKQAFNLLGTKVADTAAVTIDFGASPAP